METQENAAYQSPAANPDTSTLSIGNYLVMMIVAAIPIVGIIMLFVWAFGGTNQNRKNYARAGLIMMLIAIVLSFILSATGLFAFSNLLSSAA